MKKQKNSSDIRQANPCMGSDFEDWLKEEGIYEEAREHAIKRTLVDQLEEEIKRQKLTKVQVAQALHTSRSGLDKILDPNNTSITLNTMMRVAGFLGKKLSVSLN
jgi:predicted XRE-type DNA-binding protein